MKIGLREVLFLMLLVAIPLGSWWFVFHPRDLQIRADSQQVQALRVKLRDLQRATATLESLQSDIDQTQKAIDFFQSKLPPEKEMDKVLSEVSKLAEASSLTIKSFRTLKRSGPVMLTDPGGPYAEQPIALELEGNFNYGLYSFLLSLEKLPRITRVHQMKIEKLAKGLEGDVHAKLVMSIFFERNGRKEKLS